MVMCRKFLEMDPLQTRQVQSQKDDQKYGKDDPDITTEKTNDK